MERTENKQILTEPNLFKKIISNRFTIIISSFALFFTLLNYLPFDHKINSGFSILALVGILWLTEAVHLSISSLLIPVLAVGLGIFDTKTALANFGHPVIYLFLGGFIIASALSSQNIDKYLAKKILNLSNGHLGKALIYLFIATAVLSMWISNLATTAIMLPMVLGLLKNVNKEKNPNAYIFALLGLAYSANIGGIGTIVGSPPNAVAASHVGISFMSWMKIGIPVVMVMLPIMIACLYFTLKPNLDVNFKIEQTKETLTNKAKLTLLVFAATALCWMNSKGISAHLGGIKYLDTLIAIIAAAILVTLNLVDWKTIQRDAEWGVLILFGGGLSLSAVLQETGTSNFIATEMSTMLSGVEPLMFMLAIIIFVIVLTQFSSNTASANILIPIFTGLSSSFNLDPVTVAAVIGVAASFAFLLPVATPPNAIVYGTGHIKQKQMISTGLIVNIVGIFVLLCFAKIIM